MMRFSCASQSSSVGEERMKASYSACRSVRHRNSYWLQVSAGAQGEWGPRHFGSVIFGRLYPCQLSTRVADTTGPATNPCPAAQALTQVLGCLCLHALHAARQQQHHLDNIRILRGRQSEESWRGCRRVHTPDPSTACLHGGSPCQASDALLAAKSTRCMHPQCKPHTWATRS